MGLGRYPCRSLSCLLQSQHCHQHLHHRCTNDAVLGGCLTARCLSRSHTSCNVTMDRLDVPYPTWNTRTIMESQRGGPCLRVSTDVGRVPKAHIIPLYNSTLDHLMSSRGRPPVADQEAWSDLLGDPAAYSEEAYELSMTYTITIC